MFVVYYSNVDPIAQFDPVTEDPNLIWIRICRVPIRQAIRRPTYKMIRRFIPIRIVQTRRQFEPNTVSFHVSVCSYVISLFTIVSRHLYITRIISCERLIYFTSMITCITSWGISERSPYLFTLYEHLLASFHVLVVRRCWLRPSICWPKGFPL